jgi:hypothetical protein
MITCLNLFLRFAKVHFYFQNITFFEPLSCAFLCNKKAFCVEVLKFRLNLTGSKYLFK